MKKQLLEHVAMFEYAFPVLEPDNAGALADIIAPVKEDKRVSPKLVKYAISKLAYTYIGRFNRPSPFHELSATCWLKHAEKATIEPSPLCGPSTIEDFMKAYAESVAMLDDYIKNEEGPGDIDTAAELQRHIDNIVRETLVNTEKILESMREYWKQRENDEGPDPNKKKFIKHLTPRRIAIPERDRDFEL